MAIADLLVHVDSGSRAPERIDLAVSLARRHGARLTGLFAESGSLGQSLVGRRDRESVEAAARRARELFEARAAAGGAPAGSRWWQLEAGDWAEVVHSTVVCCRYADCAVFGQEVAGRDSPAPEGLVERVIADAGRPVLVVPAVGHHPEAGRRVLVGWTGSREAARALHDALPLLEKAEEVTVLSLQLPNASIPGGLPSLDVAQHLRAHGISARYERAILQDVQAVDMVLNRACDLGADLTVVGAHGLQRGGVIQRGETTRALLETMTTPTWLAC